MTKFKLNNTYLPLIFIFVSVHAASVIFDHRLDEIGINHIVVQAANALMLALMLTSAFWHFKAMHKSNPHAFLRSVLSATVLKLFVIAGATLIYLLAAGANRSVYAVLVGMGLYILYTVIELRGIFRLNKENTDGAH